MNLIAPIGIAALTFMTCPAADQAQTAAKSCGENSTKVVNVAYAKEMDIVDTAVGAGNFKTLAAALGAAGLVDTLKGAGPFTVFAPTDAAFAKLPAGTVETLLKPENKGKLASILTYHVVPGNAMAKDVTGQKTWTTVNGQRVDISEKGGKWMIDGATITTTDIKCSNGVIHVIDSVIMPEGKNIVETAVGAKFNTLAKLLTAADLVSTLEGAGPFTVFAPTDEAFAKLPKETVESLLKPENKATLVKILTYHVVPGRVYADQVVGMTSGKTVQGSSFAVAAKNGKVMIDNATVTKTDIEASNGVIHVIDTVIMPK
jgi:transforming growth factor-beta-induced protein